MTYPIQENPFFKSQRSSRVSLKQGYTGIDYIDVNPGSTAGWNLLVHFLPGETALPSGITSTNIRITSQGGAPTPLEAESVTYPEEGGNTLTVHITERCYAGASSDHIRGFFLELIDVPGVDPFFSKAYFLLGHGTSLEPRQFSTTYVKPQPVTEIDYLCKDYASFRRLILDHLSLLVPRWKERHAPDLGITLVEIMAYAADYLSYYQDAAATEAYPGTARRRISLRRHARLLDYFMQQGTNSRVLVQIQVNNDFTLEKSTPLLTKITGQPLRISPGYYKENILFRNPKVRVFETMYPVNLFQAHNEMYFYTWGSAGFTLEKGSVSAALAGHFPHLKAGDLLIFIEEGHAGQQLPSSHPVRLTRPAVLDIDRLNGKKITWITWADEDALPKRLQVNRNDIHGASRISVLGNIVPADYGRTVPGEFLPAVPVNGRYYPRLKFPHLIFSVPYREKYKAGPGHSAKNIMDQDPAHALPAVELEEYPEYFTDKELEAEPASLARWTACRDLLNSSPFDRNFVVEAEENGAIYLRFGDGILGKKPVPGTRFKVKYRIGNNLVNSCIEPGTITHSVTTNPCITGIRNPASSSASIQPESLQQTRMRAPHAFQTQERCITLDDYVKAAERHPQVRKAQVRIHWTGSWRTAFIYIDRKDGKPVDQAFKTEIRAFMEPLRTMGVDLEIESPRFVSLCIMLTVYTYPKVPKNPTWEKLTAAFSNVMFPDGSCGFFYPGNFTFAQPLYLSRIVDRAMQVTGVKRVHVDAFRRMDAPPVISACPTYMGRIDAGPLEILRLDNHPGDPGKGIITFRVISEES